MAHQVFILTLLLVAIVGLAMASEAPSSSPKSSPSSSSSPKSSPKTSPSPTTASSPVASPPAEEMDISSPPAATPESSFYGFGSPQLGPAVVVGDAPASAAFAPAIPADQTSTSGASVVGVSALVVAMAGFFAF